MMILKNCSHHNVIFKILFMSKSVLFVHLCSSNVLTYNLGCIIVKVVSLIYLSDKTFLSALFMSVLVLILGN